MSDSAILLAVFEDIEPAVKGIEKLHEFGLDDGQINVISGIPIKETILDRPSPANLCLTDRIVWGVSGFDCGNIPNLRHSIFVSFACRWTADIPGTHGVDCHF